jgi:hypothetical protein
MPKLLAIKGKHVHQKQWLAIWLKVTPALKAPLIPGDGRKTGEMAGAAFVCEKSESRNAVSMTHLLADTDGSDGK